MQESAASKLSRTNLGEEPQSEGSSKSETKSDARKNIDLGRKILSQIQRRALKYDTQCTPNRDFSPNLKQDLSGLSGFF